MFKIFSGGKKNIKDNARCFVIDIRHPIKIKPAVIEPSINKSEFLDFIKNKTKNIADRAKTIFTRFISTRPAMIVIAIVLALGGFFIVNASVNQFNIGITENITTRTNAGLGFQNIYTEILGFLSPIRETPALISSFREFNRAITTATEVTQALRAEWLYLILNNGEEFVTKLKKTENETKSKAKILVDIKDRTISLGASTEATRDMLTLQYKTQKEAEFLSKMINLVRDEGVIAMFFINNLETKITDKFIKSYAVVKLTDGEVKDILVNDIPYLDQFVNTKIALQVPFVDINTNEEVKNINQFFNFLASAPKMLGFLEALPTYTNQKIKFDGAIAINYETIVDILRITGPIKLSEHNIIFDQNNFLTEIQKELSKESMLYEAEDKNVLTLFITEMMSKIQKISEWEMRELTSIINHRLNNQDIQFYFTE